MQARLYARQAGKTEELATLVENSHIFHCLGCDTVISRWWWLSPFCDECQGGLAYYVWITNHDGVKTDLREMFPVAEGYKKVLQDMRGDA